MVSFPEKKKNIDPTVLRIKDTRKMGYKATLHCYTKTFPDDFRQSHVTVGGYFLVGI